MGVFEVLTGLLKWCLPAVCVMAAGFGITFFIYKIIYIKILHGTKRIGTRSFALFILLIGYLFLVFALTNLGRGANYAGWINLNILSGYIDAWNSWSFVAFQLILFNIVLFIPLGILMPCISKKLRSFKTVFLIALGITLFNLALYC